MRILVGNILVGDKEDIKIKHFYKASAIRAYELGRTYRTYMDATFLNYFIKDSKLIFVANWLLQPMLSRIKVMHIDAPLLSEVYAEMMRLAQDEFYIVGNIHEMRLHTHNKTGYRAELFHASLCPLTCLRRLYIDDILEDLNDAH